MSVKSTDSVILELVAHPPKQSSAKDIAKAILESRANEEKPTTFSDDTLLARADGVLGRMKLKYVNYVSARETLYTRIMAGLPGSDPTVPKRQQVQIAEQQPRIYFLADHQILDGAIAIRDEMVKKFGDSRRV